MMHRVLQRDYEEDFAWAENIRRFSAALFTPDFFPAPEEGIDAIVTFFQVRAHTVFVAGVKLCEGGFAPESVMQARALMESLINLRYMIDNPSVAHRYAEWDSVIKYRALQKIRDLPAAFENLKNEWEQQAEEIDARYREFRETYSDFSKYRWAGQGKSIRALAEETQSEDLYSFYFSFGSEIVHGSTVTSEYYMAIEEDGTPRFFMESRDRLVREALRMLAALLLLHWDEVSIQRGEPTISDLGNLSPPPLFQYFSRRSHEADAN